MIIKRLTLHNFGIYASDNTFLFKEGKNVTLIGGMNGRGKTTFLEAVLLALYGSNSFAVEESGHKSYGNYLRAHVNTSDGTNESFVELEFDMDSEDNNNTYIVTRTWNTNGKYVRDSVNVKKNGTDDKFLTQNWTMFVESVLPSGLANFFFFDGEKIAELAEGDTNDQMKDSIKSLLGINVIDLLQNDLKRVGKRLSDEKSEDYSATLIDELRQVRDEKESELKAIDLEIESLAKQIIKTTKDLEKKKSEFEAKGGKIADQSKALFSERGNLGGRLEQMRSEFIELAASELPLAMLKPSIDRIVEQSSKEREQRSMKVALEKITEIFAKYSQNINCEHSEVSAFINYAQSQTHNSNVDNIFNLSDAAHAQCTLLSSAQLENAKRQYLTDKASFHKMESRINEIDNYLSVDIDEKAIQRIYKKICELENTLISLQVQVDAKKKDRISIHGDYLKAATEFNRCVESSLKTMEREDDVQRLSAYVNRAQFAAERYKLKLQEAKVQKLAFEMTCCYKKLLGKKNLIDKIVMDPVTLDYSYLDKSGNPISKSALSAGEKQLMVISMLWALGKCSKRKLPVIIDTPLARLDSVHRTALIDRYFPKASDQTIILSTDVEIDSTYYPVIKKHVGNEFTLVYDEETRRSIIEEGYFKGVIE